MYYFKIKSNNAGHIYSKEERTGSGRESFRWVEDIGRLGTAAGRLK